MPLSINTTPSPITSIAFVPKKADITFEAFKHHYETHHIPLFVSLVDGAQYISSYILHYAPRNKIDGRVECKPTIFTPPKGTEDWEFDAIARVVYKSQEAYDEVFKRYKEQYERISEDEATFIDQEKVKGVIVKEGESTEFVLK